MKYIPIFISCLLASSLAADISSITSGLEKSIQREIADVKQPVEEAIVYIGTGPCANVKRIAGVAYDQLDNGKEPDLNNLTLVYIRNDNTATYSLSQAAELIPEAPFFDPNQKLYIYIHGFTAEPKDERFTAIREALFNLGESNVLALDASSLISSMYLRGSTYASFIGEKLGEVLVAITKKGVDPAQIHIIGHSLGAHVSGFTGKQFVNSTGNRVGRISGLDPAGPCFSNVDENLRLKETDADFVDVIHTAAGTYAITEPCGHVDYYPNGGHQQPECFLQTCNHNRVWKYYAESLKNPEAFPAVKCDSWDAFKAGKCSDEISYMGHPSTANAAGKYYLQTAGQSPYGLGLDGTKYKNDDGVIKNVITNLLR